MACVVVGKLNSNMFSTMPKEGITNANIRFTGIAWNDSNIKNCPSDNGLLYSINYAATGFQLFIGYQNTGIWYRDTTNTMDNNWIKIS